MLCSISLFLIAMSESRVSAEELEGDLEKLQYAMQTLLNSNLKYSSLISNMRDKYGRVFKLWVKSKHSKPSETILEDTKSKKIIVDQNLDEFIPTTMKPARYICPTFIFVRI